MKQVYAYFGISGSFDPDEITRRLGIPATRSYREGELLGGKTPRKHSHWSLHSRLDDAQRLEKHVTDVLEQMDSNAEGFEVISAEFGGRMELVGTFEEYPGLFFDAALIKKLARFGLELDVDLYLPSKDS